MNVLYELMFKQSSVPCFSDYVNGGELFTHLNIRERFTAPEVQLFSAEILLALEHLHKVCKTLSFNVFLIITNN